jgi:hypothetical protein
VTWFGTDADGKQLQSASLSMSRFRRYSVGSLFRSAKGIYNSTIEQVKDTYDDVVNKAGELVDGFKETFR